MRNENNEGITIIVSIFMYDDDYNIYIYIGCFNIHETHVTASDSTYNNIVLFFVSDLKIEYYNNSSITIPWTREEKIFCVTYLETK